MFHQSITVRLHETDAAGVIFYSQVFKYIHDAYESLCEHLGFPLPAFLAANACLLPIAHAEADYTAPVRWGDRLTLAVAVEHIGENSFTLFYKITNDSGKQVASAKTVHVAVAPGSGKKTPLSASLLIALNNLAKVDAKV